eukprot:5990888-Prymnesium_polylepis.2
MIYQNVRSTTRQKQNSEVSYGVIGVLANYSARPTNERRAPHARVGAITRHYPSFPSWEGCLNNNNNSRTYLPRSEEHKSRLVARRAAHTPHQSRRALDNILPGVRTGVQTWTVRASAAPLASRARHKTVVVPHPQTQLSRCPSRRQCDTTVAVPLPQKAHTTHMQTKISSRPR